MATDLLGRTLTGQEEQLLGLYQQTKALLQQPDLAPNVQAQLRIALSALWNVMNDLDLEYEQLYDLGV